MQIPAEPIIYGLIFIGVIVLVEGVYLVAFGKSISLNSRVNRRLEMLDKGTGREQVLEQLRKEMRQHMSARSIPLYSLLADRAQKAAIAFTPRQLIMLMVGVSCLAFLGLTIGTEAPVALRLIASVGIGTGGIYFWVNKKAKKRMSMIEEQLPDAVELMVRSLRVGHPFSSAITIVSKEIEDPLATEFGIIFDQVSYGDELTDAFNEFAERVEIEDVSYLAASIGIQHGTGGDLAEVIDILSRVIRARIALRRKVHSISAEGRLTAWFLSALPVIMFVFTMGVSPDYYGGVMDHPWFMPMAGIVIGFTVLNAVILRKLVNFKV